MSNCELVVTEDGFSVGDTQYYRLEVAAHLVGLHPQSLQRLRRYGGAMAGTKIGRILFFTAADMAELGYPININGEGIHA